MSGPTVTVVRAEKGPTGEPVVRVIEGPLALALERWPVLKTFERFELAYAAVDAGTVVIFGGAAKRRSSA